MAKKEQYISPLQKLGRESRERFYKQLIEKRKQKQQNQPPSEPDTGNSDKSKRKNDE